MTASSSAADSVKANEKILLHLQICRQDLVPMYGISNCVATSLR